MRRPSVLAAVLSAVTPAAVVALPVISTPAAAAAPKPVTPVVRSLPLTGVDPAAVRAHAAAPAGATGRLVLTGEQPTDPFSALGLTWARDPAVGELHAQVRVRTGGRWSDWQDVETEDAAPDAGSKDAAGGRPGSSSMVWVGRSDGVQVKVDPPAGAAPRDLRLQLIDPGTAAYDATIGRSPTLGRSTATADVAVPPIISRAQWGADESLRSRNGADCAVPAYSDTVKVGFVHHTDGSNNYGPGDSAAIVRSIYAFHVQGNKWCDVGYNFLVDRYGQIFEGRWGGVDRPMIGAHTGGFNSNSFAASMIGNFSSVASPPATLDAVAKVFAWKLAGNYRNPQGQDTLVAAPFDQSRFRTGQNVAFNVVSADRDADYTSCPGDTAYRYLPEIRNRVRAYAGIGKGLIQQTWESLGGPASWLGSPFIGEANTPGGRVTFFNGGSLWWSPATGVQEVHGAILGRYVGLGGSGSALGFPTGPETDAPGGRMSPFQHGGMYWSPAGGAFEVHGDIRGHWLDLGGPGGWLGLPASDEYAVPGGRASAFRGATVYWSAATGAREVHGDIAGLWAARGGPGGFLGFPTSDEYAVPGGRASDFRGGRVYWGPAVGAHEVYGDILGRYLALGGPGSTLGLPTSSEYAVPGGRQSDFEHGSLRWDAAGAGVTLTTR